MAICTTCGGEMTRRISCSTTALITIGDTEFEPIRWGDEPRWWNGVDITFPCHDCGTPPGGVHHPGCDAERCPACHGQALSCDCNDDPYDEYDELQCFS